MSRKKEVAPPLPNSKAARQAAYRKMTNYALSIVLVLYVAIMATGAIIK